MARSSSLIQARGERNRRAGQCHRGASLEKRQPAPGREWVRSSSFRELLLSPNNLNGFVLEKKLLQPSSCRSGKSLYDVIPSSSRQPSWRCFLPGRDWCFLKMWEPLSPCTPVCCSTPGYGSSQRRRSTWNQMMPEALSGRLRKALRHRAIPRPFALPLGKAPSPCSGQALIATRRSG